MDEEGISMDDFKKTLTEGNLFASGTGKSDLLLQRLSRQGKRTKRALTCYVYSAVDYGASVITAKGGKSAEQGDGTNVMGDESLRVISKQALATNIKVGMRMTSFKVLNQADARPWHFQELLRSRGCWRLVLLAGNVANPQQKERIDRVSDKLGAESSFLKRFTPANRSYDSVIEVLTVHSAPRKKVTIFDFAPVLRPWDEVNGWDYWKIFVDDQSYHEGHGRAYENWGVDPEKGCAVVVRPDQHVSFVTEVDDYEGLEKFFQGFMVEQKSQNKQVGQEKRVDGAGDGNATPGNGVSVSVSDEAVKGSGSL